MQTIIEQMVATMDAIKADINKVDNKRPRPELEKILLFWRSSAKFIARKPARNNLGFIKHRRGGVVKMTCHLFYYLLLLLSLS